MSSPAQPGGEPPSEVVAEGRLFCSFDPGEEFLALSVERLGEDIWLLGTDYPHQGSCFPDGVSRIVDLPELSESAKKKVLGANAVRMCPRLARGVPLKATPS